MAKANNPSTVSGHYGVSTDVLRSLGVLDATLAIDTKLFIDPLLLEKSAHTEIHDEAATQYRQRFELIINLIEASVEEGDPAWKAAYNLLDFPEVAGTCLGYGAASIRGSGWGPKLRHQVLSVASKVVRIGVKHPDLFPALALFEGDMGPDRLSDMTANISLRALEKFNARALKEIGLGRQEFDIHGESYAFLLHPLQTKSTPLILVPTDILRDLPIALDWDGVQSAASANRVLRAAASKHITEIWKSKTKRDRAELKKQAMDNLDAFNTLLIAVQSARRKPYNVEKDPENLIRWANIGREYAYNHPGEVSFSPPNDINDVHLIVREVVARFRHLIEDCGLSHELYVSKGKPRHESSAQRLFFAISYSYCKAFNVDVSPEIDTGSGKIDFKFSQGFESRVLVEIKLSTNHAVVPGYTKQLDVYKSAQETTRAIYLVIDVGQMGNKDKDLVAIKNRATKRRSPVSDLEFVDGIPKPTASKRR